MIVFDPKKVSHEYVFINSVGRNSIRIDAGGDSQPYLNQFDIAGRYIKKTGEFSMKVHQSVTSAFLATYKTKHFKTKKACIFVYEGEVLFIDCGYESYSLIDGEYIVDRRFSSSVSYDKGWVSGNIEAMNRVGEIIDNRSRDGVCILDGSNLIIRQKDATKVSFMGDEKISLEEVYFLDLSRLVRRTSDLYMKSIVKRYTKILGLEKMAGIVESVSESDVDDENSLVNEGLSDLEKSEKSEKVKSGEDESEEKGKLNIFDLRKGVVFVFNYGDDGSESGISPLIASDSLRLHTDSNGMGVLSGDHLAQVSLFTNKVIKSNDLKERKNNEGNQLRTNLHYIITAAKVVSRHYGYDKTDFLDIPEVISQVGTINLVGDIEFNDRIQTIVGMDYFSAISFICGFINREERLEVVRDLRTAFLSIIRYGFFYGCIDSTKVLGESDIPLFDITKLTGEPDLELEENQDEFDFDHLVN